MAQRRAGVPSSGMGRLIMAAILVAISVGTYMCSTQENPITGQTQRVAITPEEEIALGLHAAPTMVAMHGGEEPNQQAQALVDDVGQRLLSATPGLLDSPWQWEFTVLDDQETINAFALPGGQLFITDALLRLLETEDELAGILGHEIGHVVGRHSAEQMAKAQLAEGLTGAAILASYDPEDPSSYRNAQMIAVLSQLVTMKFGREDELESDNYGVQYMGAAGYNPCELISVMAKLDQASQGARPPEFLSTHPDPGNRIERIQQAINEHYPDRDCSAFLQ